MIKQIIRKYLTVLLFGAFTCLSLLNAQTEENSNKSIKEIFEREYEAYREGYRQDFEELLDISSSVGPRALKPLQNIAKLGPPVLPYLMEKVNQTKNRSFTLPLIIITKKRFAKSEWPEGKLGDSDTKIELYIDWWKKGRKQTYQQFAKQYSELKGLKIQGKEEEAKEKLEQIRWLGVAALPMLAEKVKEGDKELVKVISKITRGKVKEDAKVSECIDWWNTNRKKWLIPFPNNQPIAKVEPDKIVKSEGTVQLDGSASSDADNDELIYQWTQLAGPAVILLNGNSAKPFFKAPVVNRKTVMTFQLVVSDANNACPTPNSESKPATTSITVNPKD